MAPEYGATCGFFPIDEETLAYLDATDRKEQRIALVEAYARAQGMFRDDDTPDPVFTDTLELDLGDVEPSIAGPKRPQDRVPLARAASAFAEALDKEYGKAERERESACGAGHQFRSRPWRRGDRRHHLLHQHLEPVRDGRCRPARPQRREARASASSPG